MQLCFLGIYGRYVAFAPYPPVLRRGINIRANSVGLAAHPRANAYHAPVIGGFVGADNVAVILATRMLESDEILMALDIGTNTEIDLGNKHLVMVDSCASGPAFEGAHITHGMRAAPGAIERVQFIDDEIKIFTIEDQQPVGICGSGIVDVVAEMKSANLMNEKGAFIEDQRFIRQDKEKKLEFLGITDHNLLNLCKHFRIVRKELVHDKIFHQSESDYWFAQDEAHKAIDLINQVTDLFEDE